MPISAAQLLVKVNADTGAAQAGIAGLSTMLGSGGILALGALGAAAAIIGIGVASTKMAGDFQSGLVTLVTGAGEAQSNLGMIHDALLQMAVDTGESTSQLISGLYMIESAGYHGAQGLAILKAAAEGAKVGNADLGTVADAVTTVLKNYGSTGLTAAQATNTLIATVANGKTHLEDLSTALANVLPTARQAGIGLNDVMAAMAAQTAMGIPAADAATHLRQMIIALEAPSSAAAKALKAVGLSTDQVAAEMHKSLPGAIKMITDAISTKFKPGSAEYLSAIKSISGGMREMQGMLALSGQNLKNFGADVGLISTQVKKGGNTVEGWSLVQGTFNQHMAVLVQVIETLMIKLGTQLLPVAQKIVDVFANGLTPAIQFVASHAQLFVPVVLALAGALIGAMVPALLAMATAGAEAITPLLPFIAIGAAIALVVAGLVVGFKALYDHFAPVRQAVAGIVEGGRFLWAILQQVGGIIAGQLAPVFRQLGGQLRDELLPTWQSLVSVFNTVKPLLLGVAIAIGGVLAVALGLVISLVAAVVVGLANMVAGAVRILGGLLQAIMGIVKFIIDLWSGTFAILADLFTGQWGKLGKDTSKLLTALKADVMQIVKGLWNAVQGLWQASVGTLVGMVSTFVSTIVGYFTTLWDKLVGHSIVPDMVNGIVSWFKQLPGRALSAIQAIVPNITGIFTGLAGSATQWGVNLMNNLANGLKSMAASVGKTASDIAGKVKNFLGWHSPTPEGPGSDADQWAPNLMKMLAAGMLAGAPLLTAAAATAASGVKAAITSGGGTLSLNGVISGGGGGGLATLPAGGAGGFGGGGRQVIEVHLTTQMDSKVVARQVLQVAPQLVQFATGHKAGGS